jgi:hypothetical protein
MDAIRRSPDGRVVRIGTLDSKAFHLIVLICAWILVLVAPLGIVPIYAAVPVGLLASVLAVLAWRWIWLQCPVVEFNPTEILVRNRLRAIRIDTDDVIGFGDAELGAGEAGKVWVLAIESSRPIVGVMRMDVPVAERARRRQGRPPRNLIGCRATTGKSESQIRSAVRTLGNSRGIPYNGIPTST